MNAVNIYGLKERDMQTLSAIFSKYSEVHKVVLFGSRAKGIYHSGSDIDIAIMDTDISYRLLRRIKSDIADSSLPYTVDLVNFLSLTNEALKEHILRVGKIFFTANSQVSS